MCIGIYIHYAYYTQRTSNTSNMLFAIVCHCGRSIGDLYPVYSALRNMIMDAELKKLGRNISPDRLHLATDFQPRLGGVLDQLGINLECCRTRFLTSVEFEELYG